MAHLMLTEEVAKVPMAHDGVLPMMVRRLDGIESELRELRGLMAQLVRVEERSNADRAEVSRLAGEVSTLRGVVERVRDGSSRTGWTVGAIERVFWLVVAAAVAVFFGRGQ